VEVHVLHRQGKSIRQISQELGISRNTVRRRLRAEEVPVAQIRARKPTKLDNYRGYLQARIASAKPDWIPASVLFEEIRAQGYSGCATTVRNYVRTMKPAPRPDPVVRFETDPGQQMQVDWGVFRLNGKRVSLYLSTLGWSRYAYGVFVDNERFDTLRRCHEHAFEEFGGVPLEVLYDNMKTVVIKRNAYGDGLHQFHAGLQDLAHHYGFLPRLCRPYRAKTKGKVERQIGYIRRSFFVPLITRYRQSGETLDLDILNLEFARWLALVANARVHGTTGDVPEQRLIEERSALLPLPPSTISGDKRVSTTSIEPTHAFEDEPLQHTLSVYDAILEQA